MSGGLKRAFTKELAKNDQEINLAYAALLFAEYLTHAFDVPLYLALLDEMAEAIQAPVLAAETDLETVGVLNQYLFGNLKFAGNSDNYYHPDNSFLNQVLELRRGIPISLSVIYLEIGWRLGLPVWGAGLPGHFIVGYGRSAARLYIDVFNRGRLLSEDDCLSLCRIPFSERDTFREQFLKPATKRAILFRMLLNLKQIYIRAEDWAAAYKTVDLMLIVQPDVITELRDRGLLAYRLNNLHAAIFDLNRYLFLVPDSSDKVYLEQQLEIMEEKLIQLN